MNFLGCLAIAGNKINDQSVPALAGLNCSQLYFLKLSRNQLTDEGLKSVLSSFDKL